MAVLFCVFGHKQKSYHKECMKATDERMNITSRAFDIIKMIKLYSWEKIFKNKINEKRETELKANYKNKIANYSSYYILDSRNFFMHDLHYIL